MLLQVQEEEKEKERQRLEKLENDAAPEENAEQQDEDKPHEPFRLKDFVLPIVSKPCFMTQQELYSASWEGEFLYDDTYSHFLTPDTLFLIELLDLTSVQPVPGSGGDSHSKRAHPIAWAFFSLLGANKKSNTENKVTLQLAKSSNFQRSDSSYTNIQATHLASHLTDQRQ